MKPIKPLRILDQERNEYEIKGNAIIGRKFCKINDRNISSKHCQIIYKTNGYFIRDNNSRNGTYFLIDQTNGLYLKNKMEIDLQTFHFIISMKKNSNIIEFISLDDKCASASFELDENKKTYIIIEKQKLEEVSKNPDAIAFISLESNGLVVMKPLDPEM